MSRKAVAEAQAVREQRLARKNGDGVAVNRRSFVLVGVLFCGKCGKGMCGRNTRSKGRDYRYYACPAKDHSYRVRADRLEAGVVTELRRLLRAAHRGRRLP